MTQRKIALSIMTLSLTTLGIMTHQNDTKKNSTQHIAIENNSTNFQLMILSKIAFSIKTLRIMTLSI
jgi:hypothetical protein